MRQLLIVLVIFIFLGCKEKPKSRVIKNTLPNYKELGKLDIKLQEPQQGDWLYEHKEKGQTFMEYGKRNPIHPSEDRNCIYMQPIGVFTPWEKKVLDWNTEYIRLFFGLKVIQLDHINEKTIPKTKKRIHYGQEQLDASYIISSVLPKRMSANALVLMAVTATDLYPKPEWNFVFGLANYKKRTGITSINRYSNTTLNKENYHICLQRLIKTSTHEIGHMFALNHCINALCLMNGMNNLEETDSRPNTLCSECLAKLSWNLNFDDISRLNDLISFMKKHHLSKDALALGNQLDALQKK